MIANIVSMAGKSKGDISHSFLQQLQLARQLESLSKIRDEHVLNTAKWLVDTGRVELNMTALRDIVKIGWIVYRYPVLDQVKLSWSEAKIVLPAVQDLSDKRIERNEALPLLLSKRRPSPSMLISTYSFFPFFSHTLLLRYDPGLCGTLHCCKRR